MRLNGVHGFKASPHHPAHYYLNFTLERIERQRLIEVVERRVGRHGYKVAERIGDYTMMINLGIRIFMNPLLDSLPLYRRIKTRVLLTKLSQ